MCRVNTKEYQENLAYVLAHFDENAEQKIAVSIENIENAK